MTSFEEPPIACRKDGQVCPRPKFWHRLLEQLPNRRRVGSGWEPPQPFILAEWWHTPHHAKQQRFHEHLKWADRHGAIVAVRLFLAQLQPLRLALGTVNDG